MNENDLSVVSNLALLANPYTTREEYYPNLIEELKEFPELSFVATIDEKVVGYAQAHNEVSKNEATLDDIAVAAEYQGKGIGKLLLNNVIEILKQIGCTSILAEVHYKCAPAIPFYYKHGFRIIGFMQNYFGSGHDAMILQKNLSN